MKKFKSMYENDDVSELIESLDAQYEQLDEGKIMTAFNVGVATYMTKQLMTPFKQWNAFKLGLIDEKGKRTDKPAKTQKEKESLSLINKFLLSIRRILKFFMSDGMIKILVGLYVVKNIIKK